jgi:diguanylate cyclase (GGDEF)-like protein/PAS domain S-box-containing protein
MGRHGAFVVVYVAAVVLGRLSRIDGSALAVVWPAAAVGFLWLASTWGHARRLLVPLVLLSVLAGVVNAVTGTGWALGAALAVANGVQALVAGAVMVSLQVRAGSAPWRLRHPGDLAALILASVAGSLAAALIGPAALWWSSGADFLPTAGAWILRNAVSTFAFAALALRLGDRELPPPLPRRGGRAGGGAGVGELTLAVVLTALAYTAVFEEPVHLPVAFLLLPLSLWAARFDTTIAAGHVLLVGLIAVIATLQGLGPFAVGSASTRVLLAQAFVAVAGLVSLVLALNRDERTRLVDDLRRAQQESTQQASLLRAVFEASTEAVTVYDADGGVVLRNRAAEQLSPAPPPGLTRTDWASFYRLRYPDGQLMPVEQTPFAQALAGHSITDVDVLVASQSEQTDRILQVSARPLPRTPGSGSSGGAVVAYRDVSAARAATAEIARARDLFSGVLAAATEQAIVGRDHDSRVMVFNQGAERMLGYSAAEVIGTTPGLFYDRDEIAERCTRLGLPVSDTVVHRAARHGHTETTQWTYLTKDGRRLQVLLTVSPLHDGNGEAIGTIGVATDITEQVRAQARLASSEQRFRTAFDTAPVGMMLVGLTGDQAGRILRVNQTLCSFTGRSEAELLSLDVHTLTHHEDRLACVESFAPFLSGQAHHAQVEKRYEHSDGSTRWGLLSATVTEPGPRPGPGPGPEVGVAPQNGGAPHGGQELLCLIEDITARRQAEEALRHQALHDALTGLANRALLSDRLEHALAAAARSGRPVGVLYLDLDGFKNINDGAGHSAGDEALQLVARRIGGCVRPGDTVARPGGDEFVVLCPDADSTSNLQVVAERIRTALGEPLPLQAGTFGIGVSIGLTMSTPRSNGEQLLRQADEAMYSAKRGGKNRVVTSDPGADRQAHHDAQILDALHGALNRHEFVLHAQPIVDLASGHITAVETLLRWRHPERGLLQPTDFLDLAESSPLMSAIGQWVLHESCRMAATWSEALGSAAPPVHVNVFGRQLESTEVTEQVMRALQRHGLPAHRLVLEISESHIPRIDTALRQELQELRARGVGIAIDDVGTGDNNLTRPAGLPIDALKIDEIFIAGLGADPACDAVVRAALGIGQSLGITVIAEGVETPHQAQLLRRYGADSAQGYLYSPPRPEPDLLEHLRQQAVRQRGQLRNNPAPDLP